jgi:hypothetical protein
MRDSVVPVRDETGRECMTLVHCIRHNPLRCFDTFCERAGSDERMSE